MAHASATVLARAFLLLAVGQATESRTCAPGQPAPGQALLQSGQGRWKAQVARQLEDDDEHLAQRHVPELQQKSSTGQAAQRKEQRDPGHRLVVEPRQLKNGTWVMPANLLQHRVASRSSGVLTETDKDTLLWVHNYLRCLHGSEPLTWDDAIAQNAQAWADEGIYEHSAKSRRQVNGQTLGENLAWGWPSRTAEGSVTAWYDEIQHTDGTPENCTDRTAPEDICHYTQVVWAGSKKLGCGLGKATVEISGTTYEDGDHYVCQYGPAGNYEGEFTANVLAPTVSEEDCESFKPPPVEETASSNCKDLDKNMPPLIGDQSGNLLSCADMKPVLWYYCTHPATAFVVTKCPASCAAC